MASVYNLSVYAYERFLSRRIFTREYGKPKEYKRHIVIYPDLQFVILPRSVTHVSMAQYMIDNAAHSKLSQPGLQVAPTFLIDPQYEGQARYWLIDQILYYNVTASMFRVHTKPKTPDLAYHYVCPVRPSDLNKNQAVIIALIGQIAELL